MSDKKKHPRIVEIERMETVDFILAMFVGIANILILVYISIRLINLSLDTGDIIYAALGIIFILGFRNFRFPKRITYIREQIEE